MNDSFVFSDSVNTAFLNSAFMISLGVVVVCLAGAVIARLVNASRWKQVVWQVVTIAMLCLIAVEVTGVSSALVGSFRTSDVTVADTVDDTSETSSSVMTNSEPIASFASEPEPADAIPELPPIAEGWLDDLEEDDEQRDWLAPEPGPLQFEDFADELTRDEHDRRARFDSEVERHGEGSPGHPGDRSQLRTCAELCLGCTIRWHYVSDWIAIGCRMVRWVRCLQSVPSNRCLAALAFRSRTELHRPTTDQR